MRASVVVPVVAVTLLLPSCNGDNVSIAATSVPPPTHSATAVTVTPAVTPPAAATPAATPEPPSSRGGASLLAPNRDRLAVCVDGAGAAASAVPEAQRRVDQALAEVVAQHPAWAQAVLGAVAPGVDAGCPSEPYLLQPGLVWEDGIPITSAGRTVREASLYLLFVFLPPPDELARVIKGKYDVRAAAQEMLCQGHQCGELSTGVYLTPQETTNETFLRNWLTRGLGLEPRTALLPNAPVHLRR